MGAEGYIPELGQLPRESGFRKDLEEKGQDHVVRDGPGGVWEHYLHSAEVLLQSKSQGGGYLFESFWVLICRHHQTTRSCPTGTSGRGVPSRNTCEKRASNIPYQGQGFMISRHRFTPARPLQTYIPPAPDIPPNKTSRTVKIPTFQV